MRLSPATWRTLRRAGSSIAGPTAAGWATDFLNAAYYARQPGERSLDDLRLAFGVLTTRWERSGRRLDVRDLGAFHAAFGRARLAGPGRGTLDRQRLLDGAERLLGPWFAEAWSDPRRRAWGIAFETEPERARHDPERRLRLARPGTPTPPLAAAAGQRFSLYPPVPLPRPEASVDLLLTPERWPDAGSETGRFTPLRRGGLQGQTFEIEIIAELLPRVPLIVRAHVTATAVHRSAEALEPALAQLGAELGEHGLPGPVPDGAEPRVVVELTTHEGHFLGRGRSRLVVYAGGEGAFLRAAGSWDPLPWGLQQAYRHAGQAAQHAFWGGGTPQASMLHGMAEARTYPQGA